MESMFTTVFGEVSPGVFGPDRIPDAIPFYREYLRGDGALSMEARFRGAFGRLPTGVERVLMRSLLSQIFDANVHDYAHKYNIKNPSISLFPR